MAYETYVLSVDGIPVGAYSELKKAQSEAAAREDCPVSEMTWNSAYAGDTWYSRGRYAVARFDTNTGLDNPYTGDLVIAINDTPGTPIEACTAVIAELRDHLGDRNFQFLQFALMTENAPALCISGPDDILESVYSYAPYPRLAAEWCQI